MVEWKHDQPRRDVMTFEEFKASRRPITDEMWEELEKADARDPGTPREAYWQYGEGYVLHERDGGYWPHAWWYAPVRRETLAEAESNLWEWRKEWTH